MLGGLGVVGLAGGVGVSTGLIGGHGLRHSVNAVGYRLGLWRPDPQATAPLVFRVQDSSGAPVGRVSVLNERGERLGVSDPDSGLVTVMDTYSRVSWYFSPEWELSRARDQKFLMGRLVVLSERERILAEGPVVVTLEDITSSSSSHSSSHSFSKSGDSPHDRATDVRERQEWESFRDHAPRLPGQPLVGPRSGWSFVEEDLTEAEDRTLGAGAGEGAASSVMNRVTEEKVGEVLGWVGVPPMAVLPRARVPYSQSLELAQLAQSGAAGESFGLLPRGETPFGEARSPSESASDSVAQGLSGAALESSALSASATLEGGAAAGLARNGDGPGSSVLNSEGSVGADRTLGASQPVESLREAKDRKLSERAPRSRERGEFQGLPSEVAERGVPVARFPKAFAQMETWSIPNDKLRRLSFAVPLSEAPQGEVSVGTDTVRTPKVVKVFGISTQKESEIALGELKVEPSATNASSGGGRLDVVVPEAARFDLVRVELPDCGGLVMPLMASSPAAPQMLACPTVSIGNAKTVPWTQSISLMYHSHGVMRYFRGGKVDAGGQAADVSGNLALFRLPTGVASDGTRTFPTVHLRHSDIPGGESVLEPESKAHRLITVKNTQNPKPRVSLVVRRDHGLQRIDAALVGRFERAFFAHFVNSKFFIPVPWQSLEQQLGTALPFDKAVARGWNGSVLDLLLDYTMVLQPRDRSVTAQWFDREGKILASTEHPYRVELPPEMLAREVYDGFLDHLPTWTAAQTATR